MKFNFNRLGQDKKDNILKGLPKHTKRLIRMNGNPVATIEAGQMFGQYALVNNDHRNAGIFCLEKSYLMVFD